MAAGDKDNRQGEPMHQQRDPHPDPPTPIIDPPLPIRGPLLQVGSGHLGGFMPSTPGGYPDWIFFFKILDGTGSNQIGWFVAFYSLSSATGQQYGFTKGREYWHWSSASSSWPDAFILEAIDNPPLPTIPHKSSFSPWEEFGATRMISPPNANLPTSISGIKAWRMQVKNAQQVWADKRVFMHLRTPTQQDWFARSNEVNSNLLVYIPPGERRRFVKISAFPVGAEATQYSVVTV